MLYCFVLWTIGINMIIYYIYQGRKKNKGSDSVCIVFILTGKVSFAFLHPHTFNWGWIHSTWMWGLINGGLYFSSSLSYPVSSWPSAQVKAVIEALYSQDLGAKMVHIPPIVESSSSLESSQLCTCKHALLPLEASRGKTSSWPDAGLAHHQFSLNSWQTEVQDELCWKEPLLAQPWQWLWGGILTSGICPCACRSLLMLCTLQCQQDSSHKTISWTGSLLLSCLSVFS